MRPLLGWHEPQRRRWFSAHSIDSGIGSWNRLANVDARCSRSMWSDRARRSSLGTSSAT